MQIQTKRPSLEEAIRNMNSLTNEQFTWEIREGIVTFGLGDFKVKHKTAWVVRDYERFIQDIKSGEPNRYLEDSLRMDNLHGWPRGNSRTNLFYDFHMGAEKIIRNLLTSEANKIYERILQSQLYALPTPNYSEYESEGCIEYPQIQFWNDDFKKLGECEQGQVILGNPLSFTIGSRREGCYDTGWWTSIQHGLTTNKRAILQKSI